MDQSHTPRWYFNQPKPGDTNREPIGGEFFATDAIRNPAEALVRESIQNSLDAGHNGETVRVRFFLSNEECQLLPEKTVPYLEKGWPHFQAERNGLKDAPQQKDVCRFLVIEDFGTTGLIGNVEQWQPIAETKNPFYYFFRAEGQSSKGELDRGRWGIGKTVFPRSSRISTLFGLTVRADDGQRLLMGKAALKSHYIGTGYFSPDGYFGVQVNEGLTLPLSDNNLLQQFCADFGLQRKEEPGLSIVVPWVDAEITQQVLIEAALRQYFYPILCGLLEVTIATLEKEYILTSASLMDEVRKMSSAFANELLPLIELASWANQQESVSFVTLKMPDANGALKWSSTLFAEEQIAKLRETMEAGEGLAVRVPVTVREKNKASQESFFDVFFVRDGNSENGRPVFVREGIIISDVRAPRNRGFRSLVVVHDKPLATLLGDSENPAHTQWQKDSSNYKNKYVYGASYIEFVTKCLSGIINALSEQDKKPDPTLLLDIFSLPDLLEVATAKTKSKKPQEKNGDETTTVEPLAPRPRLFMVQQAIGGFSIVNGNMPPPNLLRVQVAYNIRRGNPLKKYSPIDFDLGKSPIKVSPASEGIKILEQREKEMIINIIEPKFNLTLTGFDDNRDLFVNVKPLQEGRLDEQED